MLSSCHVSLFNISFVTIPEFIPHVSTSNLSASQLLTYLFISLSRLTRCQEKWQAENDMWDVTWLVLLTKENTPVKHEEQPRLCFLCFLRTANYQSRALRGIERHNVWARFPLALGLGTRWDYRAEPEWMEDREYWLILPSSKQTLRWSNNVCIPYFAGQVEKCGIARGNTTDMLAKKTRVPAIFYLFGPPNGGFFLLQFGTPEWSKKNPGIFAPSGRAEIQKMLKVDVQEHQNSTGFIRFSTWRDVMWFIVKNLMLSHDPGALFSKMVRKYLIWARFYKGLRDAFLHLGKL